MLYVFYHLCTSLNSVLLGQIRMLHSTHQLPDLESPTNLFITSPLQIRLDISSLTESYDDGTVHLLINLTTNIIKSILYNHFWVHFIRTSVFNSSSVHTFHIICVHVVSIHIYLFIDLFMLLIHNFAWYQFLQAALSSKVSY